MEIPPMTPVQSHTDPFEYSDGLVLSPPIAEDSLGGSMQSDDSNMPKLKALNSGSMTPQHPLTRAGRVGNEGEGLALCNISVAINSKQILHNVSGQIPKGSLCAILGPSGAGKSTLLNVIGRKQKAEGRVALNGRTPSRKDIGYVKQSVKMWDLSVRDVMKFCSDLKLTLPSEEKATRIGTVMDEVCLAEDVYCGTALECDKKKTSLCVELLSDPALLLLDEPTSGLDSVSTSKLIQSLKKQAMQRTVVATIHQPSSAVFDAFDYLIFLVDGCVVYCGDASLAEGYFSQAGAPYPENCNPAEHILQEVSLSKERYVALWQQRTQQHVTFNSLNWNTNPSETDTVSIRVGPLVQIKTLLWREWKELRNDPAPYRGRLIRAVVFPLLMIVFFFQSNDTPEGVHAKRSIIFLSILEAVQEPLLDTARSLPEHIAGIYDREVEAGLYSALPYILSKVVAESVKLCPLAVVYSIMCYWGAGLVAQAESFVVFVVLYYTVAMCAFSTAMMFSAGLRGGLVLVASSIVIPVMLLTSGHIIPVDGIPLGMRWLASVSLVRYGYDAGVITEFASRNLTCNEAQASSSCTGDGLIATALPASSSMHRSCMFFASYIFVLLFLSFLFLKFRK